MSVPDVTAGSPFDAIRQTRPDGSEFWSARDLQSVMNYTRWAAFKIPIERAMKAAENQGHDVTSHFRGSAKVVERPQGGGSTHEDFHLTRFAAYLVAMNGDPNKPEVAAAQAYFAIQTRIAETAHVPATPAIPQTYSEALRAAADQAERAGVAERKSQNSLRRRTTGTTSSRTRTSSGCALLHRRSGCRSRISASC